MDYQLRQRGRAGLDFLLSLGRATGGLRPRIESEFKEAGITPDALPDDLDQRERAVTMALANAPAWRLSQEISEFSGDMHGQLAADAYGEIRDDIEPQLRELENRGPATLTLDPDFRPPAYYDGVWFHRTTGGWDGHPDQGFIHGELIHRHIVARLFGGDIFAQRRSVLADLPRQDFRRILEMATSSGHYTVALQQTFPEARITGVDVSAPMLKQALRVANANGWAWDLHQMAGEATSFPDASFDLVTAYSFLHEIPAHAIRAVFAEAFRLLEPGGHVLISDVTPYQALDKLGVWRADHAATHGGEPYWREAASLDWGAAAREAGFVDVRSFGRGERQFPWSVMGRKP